MSEHVLPLLIIALIAIPAFFISRLSTPNAIYNGYRKWIANRYNTTPDKVTLEHLEKRECELWEKSFVLSEDRAKEYGALRGLYKKIEKEEKNAYH